MTVAGRLGPLKHHLCFTGLNLSFTNLSGRFSRNILRARLRDSYIPLPSSSSYYFVLPAIKPVKTTKLMV
jgi:hypothetical protein